MNTTIQSINDLASLKLIIIFTWAIMIVLIGIISYFLSRRDTAIYSVTESLTSAVVDLKLIVKRQETLDEIRQPMIDTTFENHRLSILNTAEKLERVDFRLVKLETEHELIINRIKINSFQV